MHAHLGVYNKQDGSLFSGGLTRLLVAYCLSIVNQAVTPFGVSICLLCVVRQDGLLLNLCRI